MMNYHEDFLIFGMYFMSVLTPANADKMEIIIISKEFLPPYKASVDIMVSQRLSEIVLKGTAEGIYKKIDGRKYQRVFITWYLPGMKVGSGAWATTYYNPELKVNIMGFMLKYNSSNFNK